MALGDIMPNIIVIIYDACLKMRKLGGGSSVRAVHGMDGMRIGILPGTNQTSGAPTRSKAPNHSNTMFGFDVASPSQ